MGPRRAREARTRVVRRPRRGAHVHVRRPLAPVEPGGQRLPQAGHRQRRRGHDDPAPPLGVLGVRRGAVQAGGHHHPCVVAAHEEGHRVPRQLRAGEGDGVRERRLRVRPDRGGAARLALHRAPRHRGGGARRLDAVRRARRRRARRVRAAHGRGGRHEQGHHARLLHVRNHGQPQGRVPQLRAPLGPHHHREVLAAGAGGHAAHVRDRQRLGEVRLGQDLRPVDRRRHHLRLRHGQVRARRSCCRRSRTTG